MARASNGSRSSARQANRRERAAGGQAAMRATMPLGDFLVAYLKRAHVSHIFGLPGDLVLGLFHRFGRARGLEIVTFSHEPSVGFAADGYARSTRRLGVVCVTYGAGGHNVVNPVAGAYAEHVPLLIVSGGPGEAESKLSLIHHQVKDVDSQRRVFEQVTCIAKLVDRADLAAEQIHEVVSTILAELRPGYIEIHRDMVDVKIPVPKWLRDWHGRYPRPRSNKRKLSEAVAETVERLRAAERPIVLGGVEIFRERAEGMLQKFVEKAGVPVVTTPLAKGIFPMDHRLHMGVSIGSDSHPRIVERVEGSDLVLALGAERTDINFGGGASRIAPENSIWAVDRRVEISHHHYDEVQLADFVRELSRAKVPKRSEKVEYYDNLKRGERPADAPLRVNDLLVEVNDFLAAHRDYHVVAESGDMLFGGLEARVIGKGIYLAQGYYASMGFAIPAAMGAQLGTGLRPLVLCGDGAFQMTGPELAHSIPKGLSPIVVLVNNEGWGIFRPVTPRQDLLDLPNWPYAEMARGWGGLGTVADTPGALRAALEAAHNQKGFALIECRVGRRDLSPLGARYIKASARRARAKSS
jgi:indolepyruvate decarboxylase